MKHIFTTTLLLLAILLPATASAHDFDVDGIYYNIINSNEVEVTESPNHNYTGSVTIPATITYSDSFYSVTAIGSTAFEGCRELTQVIIPNSVTSINGGAFDSCTRLANIIIPNSVTFIGDMAFWGCTGLEDIYIPNSVTFIGFEPFYDTPWYNNQQDGLVYAGLVAYKYKGTMPDNTTLSLRDGTLGIASGAFYNCSGLTSITIPNSVTTIGEEAFSDCSNLTDISVPISVTSIGRKAFMGTPWYENQPDGLIYAGFVAYKYKGTMPDNTTISLREGTLSITNEAFANCSGLMSITIPNSVINIGEWAFRHCSELTSITVQSGNLVYDSRDNCNAIIKTANNTLITGCKTTIIPNSVNTIGRYAFYGHSKLTSINIPNSVSTISEYAFSGCTGLTSIDIPNSVTVIGEGAFSDCINISTIVCHATIPPMTDSSAFSEATYNNATLTVPKGCLNAYQSADGWKRFSNIQEQAYDFEVDGIYYNINGNDATVTYRGTEFWDYDEYSGNVVIPSTVTYGGITYSVTAVGDCAFADCMGLTSVEIPNSVTSIGVAAFSDCRGLTSVEIPNTITSISKWAFSDCRSLTSINIPESITIIDEGVFNGCYKLTNANIPNSVTTIGEGAFGLCYSLTDLYIPKAVNSISCYAFNYCYGLTNITVDSANTVYDSRDNCNAIIETSSNFLITGCKNTIIPNTVIAICMKAFSGCTELTNIVIPNSVTGFFPFAFQGCSGLTSINIPRFVEYIDMGVFDDCSGLTDVYSYITDPSIVQRGLGGRIWPSTDGSKRTLHVPYGTLAAYQANNDWGPYFGTIVEMDNSFEVDGIFYRSPSNDNTVMVIPNPSSDPYSGNITIPANVTYDGTTYTVTSIAEQAFANCPGLTSITIPSSVTSVGKQAFQNDAAIESVTCEAMTSPAWEALDLFTANVYNHSPLFVPKGCARAYMSDQCWGQFAKIIGTGDINGDGNISVGDVTMLIGMVLGGGNSSPAADVNGDGSITVSDVTALISMVLGSH